MSAPSKRQLTECCGKPPRHCDCLGPSIADGEAPRVPLLVALDNTIDMLHDAMSSVESAQGYLATPFGVSPPLLQHLREASREIYEATRLALLDRDKIRFPEAHK